MRFDGDNARRPGIDPIGRPRTLGNLTGMTGARPQHVTGRPDSLVARVGRHRRHVAGCRRLGVDGGTAAWLAGIWAAHLVYWFVVFRFHLLQGDDFLNAGKSGQPGGRTTLAQWWSSHWYDYTQVNGRAADSLVRALLAPGPWLWPVLAPGVFTVIAVLLWRWTADGFGPARPGWRLVLPAAAGASWALVAVATWPRIGGDALFWMSASMSYVVPTGVTLFIGLRLAAHLRGEPARTAQVAATAAAILAAHLLHEVSSFTTAALVVACWLLGGRRGDRTLVGWTVTSAVGLTAQLAAPGFWARFAVYSGDGGGRGGAGWPQTVPAGAYTLWLATWPVLVALVALVAALLAGGAAAGRLPARRAWVAAGAAGAGTVLGLLILALRALLGAPEGSAVAAPVTVLLWLATALLAGGLAAAAPPLATCGFRECALALAGAAGAVCLPLALGIGTVRAYLPTLVWLLAATLAAAGPALTPGRCAHLPRARCAEPHAGALQRRIAIAVLGSGCAIAVPASALVLTGMAANAARWEPAAAQLDEAARGARVEVTLPASFPRPEYLYARAFEQSHYEGFIRLYYGLPDDVELTWSEPVGESAPGP